MSNIDKEERDWLFSKNGNRDTLNKVLEIEEVKKLREENSKLKNFITKNYIGDDNTLLKKIKAYEEYIKEIDVFKSEIKSDIDKSYLEYDSGSLTVVENEYIRFPEKVFILARATTYNKV